ncbi:MAG TPA: Fe-S cluster assembly protein SufD [Gammaproteobacteria bacterium]
MSASVLHRRFERERVLTPGPFDERRRALDAFLTAGFPTRRDEAWRYTDLKPIAEGDFDVPPREVDAAVRERVRALLADVAAADAGDAAARIVVVDGRLDEALSRLDGSAGLEIVRLAPEQTADGRRGAAPHPLALLNRAFASDGVTLRTARGADVAGPVELFLVASGEGRIAQHPRVAVELGEGSRLDVVVHCVDAGNAEGWLNVVFDVTQHEDSRLALHRLQEHGARLHHTSLLRADVGRNATFVAGYADLGARVARNDIDVRLAAPGARADVFGVFVAAPGRHVDDEVYIEHAARETASDTAFRGIADRTGRGVFRGKVLVQRDAQKVDARQKSDNLLLAEQAEIDTRPELEIYADDVKCSHGATVGEIDADQMFYLRSRGVDEQNARALLTFAFANRLLARLAPERLRERATRLVAGQLPAPPAWEDVE